MLSVPPKSSGGATNRCVMSRLTKCAAPGPFQTGVESGVPSAVCRSDVGAASARRPRSGDRSGSMTRAPRAGGPARFPAGLCGGQRLCALRSRALSVEHSFYAPVTFRGCVGALDGEVQQLARGRVDPMRVLVMGPLALISEELRAGRTIYHLLDISIIDQLFWHNVRYASRSGYNRYSGANRATRCGVEGPSTRLHIAISARGRMEMRDQP
jgi:hypothetical protein